MRVVVLRTKDECGVAKCSRRPVGGWTTRPLRSAQGCPCFASADDADARRRPQPYPFDKLSGLPATCRHGALRTFYLVPCFLLTRNRILLLSSLTFELPANDWSHTHYDSFSSFQHMLHTYHTILFLDSISHFGLDYTLTL